MQVKPLGKRVLIKIALAEEKTKSGIIIPVTAQEKTNKGEVIALGDVSDVKVGQTVMYDKYAGTEFQVDQETYILIESKDILGILG